MRRCSPEHLQETRLAALPPTSGAAGKRSHPSYSRARAASVTRSRARDSRLSTFCYVDLEKADIESLEEDALTPSMIKVVALRDLAVNLGGEQG